MNKSIESVILEGYRAWRKNLVITVPFILNTLAGFFLITLYFAAVLLVFNPLPGAVTDPSDIWRAMNWMNVLIDICLIFPLILLALIFSAFFTAGALGMAARALEKGRTDLDDMVAYGRRKWLDVLLAEVLIAVIMFIAGMFFLVLQFILQGQWTELYSVLVTLLFALVPYAIVYGDLGVFSGIDSGVRFFWNNKFQVTLLWAFVGLLEKLVFFTVSLGAVLLVGASFLLIAIPTEGFPAFNELVVSLAPLWTALVVGFISMVIVSDVVISPLVTLFWMGLYIDGSRKPKGG